MRFNQYSRNLCLPFRKGIPSKHCGAGLRSAFNAVRERLMSRKIAASCTSWVATWIPRGEHTCRLTISSARVCRNHTMCSRDSRWYSARRWL